MLSGSPDGHIDFKATPQTKEVLTRDQRRHVHNKGRSVVLGSCEGKQSQKDSHGPRALARVKERVVRLMPCSTDPEIVRSSMNVLSVSRASWTERRGSHRRLSRTKRKKMMTNRQTSSSSSSPSMTTMMWRLGERVALKNVKIDLRLGDCNRLWCSQMGGGGGWRRDGSGEDRKSSKHASRS